MNVPNAITVARIALVPVFIALAVAGSEPALNWALGVFAVASFSDFLDGHLARRHGDVSRLGKFLDPLADKLLIGAALVVLVAAPEERARFPLWAVIVIGGREVIVTALRTKIVRRGGDLPASSAAKAKTVLQVLMVSYWLAMEPIDPVHWILLGIVVALTVWSGLEYLVRYVRVREVAAEG